MIKKKQFHILMVVFSMINLNEALSKSCLQGGTWHTNHNISIFSISCANETSDTLVKDLRSQLVKNPYCMRENQQIDLQIQHSLILNLTWNTFLGVPPCKFHSLNLTDNYIKGISKKAFAHFFIKSNLDLSYNEIESDQIQADAFDSLSELRNLNLSHNKLETIKLNMFTGLISLEKICLSYNRLRYIEIGGFETLKNLRELYVDNNKLETLGNNVFLGLKKLNCLYLQQNNLSTVSYEVFLQLNELNLLNFNNNQILFLTKKTFGRIPSLQKLYLTQNNISNIEPESFLLLRNLNTLKLNSNNLPKLRENVFVNLKNLEILDLSDNRLILNSSEIFNGLVSLRNLTMSNNQIEEVPLGTFKSFPLLQNLLLNNNNLSELPLGIFSNLRNLKYLNISNNNFSVLNGSELFSLHNLEALDLDNNRIAYFNYYSLLSYLPHLHFISINNNNWTCEFLITMLEVFQSRNVDYISDKTSTYTDKNIDGIFCTETYTFNLTKFNENMIFPSMNRPNNYDNGDTLIPLVKNISGVLNQLLPQHVNADKQSSEGTTNADTKSQNIEIDNIYENNKILKDQNKSLTILSIFNIVGLICLGILTVFVIYKQYFGNNRQNSTTLRSSSELELLEVSN